MQNRSTSHGSHPTRQSHILLWFFYNLQSWKIRSMTIMREATGNGTLSRNTPWLYFPIFNAFANFTITKGWVHLLIGINRQSVMCDTLLQKRVMALRHTKYTFWNEIFASKNVLEKWTFFKEGVLFFIFWGRKHPHMWTCA